MAALIVPADAYGIHVLYEPAPPVVTSVDIVALHGLGGGCYSTWAADNGCVWLRDLLKEDANTARIMTYGYDAGMWKKAPEDAPYKFGRNFLGALDDKRLNRNQGKRRPIILVAHSLGGIVVKEALIYAHDRQDLYGDILRSVRHIVFFGTPHQGTNPVSIAGVLNKIGKWVTNANDTSVLENLELWSQPVLQTNQRFVNLADALSFTTYVEEETLHGAIIVQEGSATLNKPRERVITIAANHKTMCKFGSRAKYQMIGDRFIKILDDLENRQAEDEALAIRLAELPTPSASLPLACSTDPPI
ncbi:hypothetical protein BKA61DRAFT_196684 [Leptodontidium sp. MPI-SDFR-AT-0119]|nr:hypothetical protein BKA61DRAFT_196684 [Leptodontidium sp. MPI-SDFR-AT-0119]